MLCILSICDASIIEAGKHFSHEAISHFSNYVVIYTVCMGPVQTQPLLPKEQDWSNQ